jgi:nitrite reductase (NADH) small subunit
MNDYDVVDENELRDGESRLVNVAGLEIGVFKSKGSFYAYLNRCPHDGGPVCRGALAGTLIQGPETEWNLIWDRDGQILYCPWHGSDFDLVTGEALTRSPSRLKGYPLKIDNGKVKITLQR